MRAFPFCLTRQSEPEMNSSGTTMDMPALSRRKTYQTSQLDIPPGHRRCWLERAKQRHPRELPPVNKCAPLVVLRNLLMRRESRCGSAICLKFVELVAANELCQAQS